MYYFLPFPKNLVALPCET